MNFTLEKLPMYNTYRSKQINGMVVFFSQSNNIVRQGKIGIVIILTDKHNHGEKFHVTKICDKIKQSQMI